MTGKPAISDMTETPATSIKGITDHDHCALAPTAPAAFVPCCTRPLRRNHMHRSPRQPTRRTAAALCLGTLALAVTACTTQPAGTSPSTPNLTGTEWRLTALGSD